MYMRSVHESKNRPPISYVREDMQYTVAYFENVLDFFSFAKISKKIILEIFELNKKKC